MNKQIGNRLLTALATLMLIVLVSLIFLLGELFKNFYVNTFTDRMEKEALLISSLVSTDGYDSSESNERLSQYSKDLDVKITIVSNSGQIAASSENKQAMKEKLRQIAELNNVLEGQHRKYEAFSVIDERQGAFHYTYPVVVDGNLENYIVLSLSAESFENFTDKIWGILVSSLGLALIIIFSIGYRITQRYTKPVEEATRVADELARGNYHARTYEDNLEETEMLGRSINILARNLQQLTYTQEMQQNRLKTIIDTMGSGLLLIDERGYINLVNQAFKDTFKVNPATLLYQLYYEVIDDREIADIIEEVFLTETHARKQIQLSIKLNRLVFEVYAAPLMGAKQQWRGVLLVFHDITELKKLEQMRKDFVANVSHELKTPITSIRGFSETLLEGAMENPDLRQQFLHIILKESERLQTLIDDLLDLSKIEQDQFKVLKTPVDIGVLLQETKMLLNQKAADKQITLHGENLRNGIVIQGDAHRLKQVFLNLINNAIAYTPAGGEITVALHDDEAGVEIEVADTGIGIQAAELPRIFERFYRIDKARSRNSGGTGLGLAIVKHLVDAHDGSIEVNSEVGKGTVFKVRLQK